MSARFSRPGEMMANDMAKGVNSGIDDCLPGGVHSRLQTKAGQYCMPFNKLALPSEEGAERDQTRRGSKPCAEGIKRKGGPDFALRATSGTIRSSEGAKDGGGEEDRTPDPHVANVVLSQLSYSPTCAQGSILADFSPRCQSAHIRNSRLGCVASEGGAPFVARRAMNLHGCALPHCAPPPAATPLKMEFRRRHSTSFALLGYPLARGGRFSGIANRPHVIRGRRLDIKKVHGIRHFPVDTMNAIF
jgi:hypothetical protein